MDEVQAAVLSVKLDYLPTWNAERRRIASGYKRAMTGSALRLATRTDEGSVAHLAVILTRDRDRFCNHLNSLGIDTDIHYPVLDCDQESQRELQMRIEDLTNTRLAADQIVSVPCFPGLTQHELERIEHALATFDGR